MFKSYWRNGFTFGLTIGCLTAIVIFLFGQAIYDLAKCHHDGDCERYAAKYEGHDFPTSWWWDWTGSLVTSDDTLAQWIMAFFTIAVTLLVWRTLVATQVMASQTQKMLTTESRAIELEYRPIITIDDVVFDDFGGAATGSIRHLARIKFQNKGRTPAQVIGQDVFRIYREGNNISPDEAYSLWAIDPAQSRGKMVPLVFSGQPYFLEKVSLMQDKFEIFEAPVAQSVPFENDVQRTIVSYRFKTAVIYCRIKYSFGIGGDKQVFETTAGYSVFPVFDAAGRLNGFHYEAIAEFWDAT